MEMRQSVVTQTNSMSSIDETVCFHSCLCCWHLRLTVHLGRGQRGSRWAAIPELSHSLWHTTPRTEHWTHQNQTTFPFAIALFCVDISNYIVVIDFWDTSDLLWHDKRPPSHYKNLILTFCFEHSRKDRSPYPLGYLDNFPFHFQNQSISCDFWLTLYTYTKC